MKLLRSFLGAALAVGLFLAPTSSEAADIRLGLGADYWLDTGATFQFTLGVDAALVGPVTVGGRFGALLITEPNSLGVPVDLVLRASIANRRAYIEGMAGPWILFKGDTIRAHGAFGFGLQGKSVSLGVEVGYLSPNPVVGLRLGWRF